MELLSKAKLFEQYFLSGGGRLKGLTTGWPSMDEYWKLAKGQLVVVTGIPSSGKSEFIDQLFLQTVALHRWHWCIFSPENWPIENHAHKLIEKLAGQPLFGGLKLEDVMGYVKDISQACCFVEPQNDDMSLDAVLKTAKETWETYRSDAFLVDPWNEIEHTRPKQMSETEYIGQMLTRLRNFARLHDVAVFVVAHPGKLQKKDDGNYPVPTPYDISGSANWRNKADVCISVWRNYQEDEGVVEVHIQKMRNKNLGKLGQIELHWHRNSGLFLETKVARELEREHAIRKRFV